MKMNPTWTLVVVSAALFARHPGLALAFGLFWHGAESWPVHRIIAASAGWILLALHEASRRPVLVGDTNINRVYTAYTLREMSRLLVMQRDLGRAYQNLMTLAPSHPRDADKYRQAMASFLEMLRYCDANAARFGEESDVVLGTKMTASPAKTWTARLEDVAVAGLWLGVMGMGVAWNRIPASLLLSCFALWRHRESVRGWTVQRKTCFSRERDGYRDVSPSSASLGDDEKNDPFAGAVGDVV